jgi:hypothetical protein
MRLLCAQHQGATTRFEDRSTTKSWAVRVPICTLVAAIGMAEGMEQPWLGHPR